MGDSNRLTKRQRCLVASKESVVAVIEPNPVPPVQEQTLSFMLDNFLSCPFAVSPTPSDKVVDEWLKSSLPGQGYSFLFTLVQRLQTHLRLKHPFLKGNGEINVSEQTLVQVFRMAFVGSRLVVFDDSQEEVYQSAVKFCKHLRKLVELTVSKAESGVDLGNTADDFETEIGFEHVLHAAITHFDHWKPTFIAFLARKYEKKVTDMLARIDFLSMRHPRFLLFAMDDFTGVLEGARVNVSSETMGALISAGTKWATKVVDPVTFVSLEEDKNQFKALFNQDIILEIMHELAINPDWVFEVNSSFHPYFSSLGSSDICCQYRSIFMEQPSEEQWSHLLRELVVSQFVGKESLHFLNSVLNDISYFSLRVMWNQGSERWRRGSERRWLTDLLDPERLQGPIVACNLLFVKDLWATFTRRTVMPGSKAGEHIRALDLLVGSVDSLSSVDRDCIAAFMVLFLKGFFGLVSDANQSMLSEMCTRVSNTQKIAKGGLVEVFEQYVGKRMVAAHYKRSLDDLSSSPQRLDVSVISSFLVRTKDSICAAVSRLPFTEAALLAARNHSATVVLSKVFSVMLVDAVLGGACTHLSRSFPEIYYYHDVRLAYVTQELIYIRNVAAVMRSLLRTTTTMSSDVITLLAESLTFEHLLRDLEKPMDLEFRQGLASVTQQMSDSVKVVLRDLILRFLGMGDVSDQCITAQTLLGHMFAMGPVYFLWKRVRNCIQILYAVDKATNRMYNHLVYPMARVQAVRAIR